MSQHAYWKVFDKEAHLVHDRQGTGQQQQVSFWCNRSVTGTFHNLTDAQYEKRCTSCVDALEKFHRDATVPLPGTMVETVTVKVQRPHDDGEGSAWDHVTRGLARKKSWIVLESGYTEEPADD